MKKTKTNEASEEASFVTVRNGIGRLDNRLPKDNFTTSIKKIKGDAIELQMDIESLFSRNRISPDRRGWLRSSLKFLVETAFNAGVDAGAKEMWDRENKPESDKRIKEFIEKIRPSVKMVPKVRDIGRDGFVKITQEFSDKVTLKDIENCSVINQFLDDVKGRLT